MAMMLVAVFDTEMQATQFAGTMKALSEQGAVLLYAMTLAVKKIETLAIVNPDGGENSDPVLRAGIGNLIRWFLQPQPARSEETASVVADKTMQLAWLGVDGTFIAAVTRHLANGKAAIVAEVEGEKTDVLDALFQSAGATVLRCVRREIVDFVIARELDSLQHEIEALEKETKQTWDGSTAQLMRKLRLVKIRFQALKESARQYSAAIRQEAEAKIVLSQERAARAEGEIRAGLERVADEVRVDYVKRAKRLNLAWKIAGDRFTLGALLEPTNSSYSIDKQEREYRTD